MYKISQVVVGVTAASMLLVACGTSQPGGTTSSAGASSSGKPLIAQVQGNTSDPFQVTLVCGATQKAKEMGVDLKVFSSPTMDASGAAANMSAALLSKPKGVIINEGQPAQFASQVRTLMNQGVPVVTWGALQPPTQYGIVTSNTNGSLVADQFVQTVGTGGGTVAVLGGVSGQAVEDARWKPMVAAIQKADPSVKVLPEQFDNYTVSKGTSIVSGLMLAHPDLKMVIAIAGPEATAAGAAVAQATKAGKVKVWGYDAPPAAVDYLRKGIITALAAQPAYLWGQTEVEVMANYFKQNPSASGPVKPNPTPTIVPLKVITKANVDDPASQPYLTKATCPTS